MSKPEFLDSCPATAKPCRWAIEEQYDTGGEVSAWDHYCIDCGEWRDWSKDTLPELDEDVQPM